MAQSTGWVILSTRYGGDIRQPSQRELAQAIDEVVTEDLNGMTEQDYAEHPNAWLRYGYDDGPVYVVDAYRDGTVICSQYADQDDVDPVRETTLEAVTREQLLSLWKRLAEGDIASIRAKYPDLGW